MGTTREGSQRDHPRVDQVKFVAVVEHLLSLCSGTPGSAPCWYEREKYEHELTAALLTSPRARLTRRGILAAFSRLVLYGQQTLRRNSELEGASPSLGLLITLRKDSSSGLNACAPYAAAPTPVAPAYSTPSSQSPDFGCNWGWCAPNHTAGAERMQCERDRPRERERARDEGHETSFPVGGETAWRVTWTYLKVRPPCTTSAQPMPYLLSALCSGRCTKASRKIPL